jgi:mannosyl-3-phosphoglycerate phosphatase
MDYVVYSDLDGTLLDDRYSFRAAERGLSLLKDSGIPLVLCSSKTRAELEAYRDRMMLEYPFIPENGSAVYVPEETFGFEFDYDSRRDGLFVIELGFKAGELEAKVAELREKHGLDYKTFSDMTVEEVALESGLPVGEAMLAKQREYSVVATTMDENTVKVFRDAGLKVMRGGRYYCIGGSDKGTAVRTLTKLYRRVNPDIKTVGLGDSGNDLDMLLEVDVPVLVQKPDGSYEDLGLSGLVKADGVGPEGWSNAVAGLLEE